MDAKTREFAIQKAKEMMAADSCCQEAKDACQAFIDAAGTDKEAEAAKRLVAEAQEDVTSIDGLIELAQSPMGVEIFGEEGAKGTVAAAKAAKENGAKYCICPACAAGGAILDIKDEILK